jgi:hypothetical protein
VSSIKELERAASLGLSGAMITKYPLEDQRFDQPEYEPFWAAAAAARNATEPAHGHATAGQDSAGPATRSARRQQPRD